MHTHGTSTARFVAFTLCLVLVLTAAMACDPTASSDPLGDPAAQDETADTPAPDGGATDTTAAPSGGAEGEEQGPAVPLDTLLVSSLSGVDDARRQVVTDAEDWASVWTELNATVTPAPAAPDVDFDARRVIVLAMGTRPTGGHSIEADARSASDGRIVVTVREVEPGPDCMTTQALTRPALAVSLEATPDPIVFEEETVVRSCS